MKKITYILRQDIFSPFGFSSRLAGNLLCMCDPLPKGCIMHEPGILTIVFPWILVSFSKVSRTYLLVNFLSICRHVCIRQQGLTTKICSISGWTKSGWKFPDYIQAHPGIHLFYTFVPVHQTCSVDHSIRPQSHSSPFSTKYESRNVGKGSTSPMYFHTTPSASN